MVRRPTWILLGVFLLLVVGLVVYQQISDTSKSDEITGDVGEIGTLQPVTPFFQVPDGLVILGLKVIDSDENTIEIRRDGGSADWVLLTQEEKADQDEINRVISQLESLTVDQALDSGIGLEAIGLSKPSYTIRLLISNGGYFTISVGDVTITQTSYYAQLNDQEPVIISKFDVDAAINLITNPPIAVDLTPTVEQ
jgi:hypothetical protein